MNDNIVTKFMLWLLLHKKMDVAPETVNWKIKNNIFLCKNQRIHNDKCTVCSSFVPFMGIYHFILGCERFQFVFGLASILFELHHSHVRYSLLMIALQGILSAIRKVIDISNAHQALRSLQYSFYTFPHTKYMYIVYVLNTCDNIFWLHAH